MSYVNSTAKSTGKITEIITEDFFKEHNYNCFKPQGKDIGIDKIVTSDKYPGREIKIQVKGRNVKKTPRWFQLKVSSAKIRKALNTGRDLNELWMEKIKMVDFWVLVSIPENEIWVFPSEVVLKIAELNYPHYTKRSDNNYSEVFYDKNGKIKSKQKELNLDKEDENGVKLYKRFARYKFDPSGIEEFFAGLR